ncbi:MAG: PAS domain-containing sensor histidine kinase [Gammaproteobacteria bacterium]|nr:PAS domain-containing sensor histidine kinase [Gammaproteobacteria bacterium]
MYERFFNYSNELLCVADFEGRFVDVNDTFTKILGYSKQELLSKKFLEFVHPDDIEATLAEIGKLADGAQTINFENRYQDINGNSRIFSWKSIPDTNSKRIYAVARDITDERTIDNNFAQLHTAVSENVIYARTDASGKIVEVNDKFCEISGYSRRELIGKTHRIINSGEHSRQFFIDMWKTISSGKVWTGPITNRRKDGSLYIVESIITPILNLDGKIESYIAIRFDITDRIEYQQESAKILKILNETGSIAKVGGWELEVETGVLSWTDETFKILGVEKRVGQKPILPEGLELFVEEHKPLIDEAVARAISHGEPYALELKAQTPSGEIKWIFTNGKANYKNGKIVTLSGTIQDIHDKKITELRYNQERQKSIQNAKFAALGELAASIAHEINNPLGIISGYTELLKYQNDGQENDKLDAILKSCERISYIVKNLKRFSRTDSEPTKHKLDLVEVTNEAISLVMPKIKRNLITFSYDMVDSAFIWANDVEIEQVIINLINNSIDAIYEKENCWVKLKIAEDNNNVIFVVEDSGSGIPDSVQIKMFEPFYTTKDINKGTGLGLSVVKGIIDDHEAQIEVDNSMPNTCIKITFPKHMGH